MDTKATVNVGEYSRYGRSRGIEPVKALDHDMQPKEKLIPGGILESVSGKAFLFFTSSYKTSDFMVDGLLLWWNERKQDFSDMKRLVLNLDNGPECSSHRRVLTDARRGLIPCTSSYRCSERRDDAQLCMR